jgi:endonuclease III
MSGSNRGPLINKLYKVLKQHYKPITTEMNRPLMEQMLFACCLENAPYDKAAKTYEHLASSFFDWNEVRVSTVNELAEAMRDLPNATAAASNLKRLLQTVFESTYSFELESMKKQNIGAGIKKLEKMEGATPFVVAFATQHALAGHFIPLDRGALDVLYIVGIATEAERQSGSVSGLERAIPKNKGLEFSSLLHQLAAELVVSPYSPQVKTILLSVNPSAKDRLPKRGQKKEPVPPPPPPAPVKAAGKPSEKAPAGKAGENGSAKPDKLAAKGNAAKDSKKPPVKAVAADSAKQKSLAKKPAATKHAASKPAAKAARPEKGHDSRPTRHPPKKSPSKQLAKRKPR